MAFRVEKVNKKTGVTYIYESTSCWDKEKKQSRNKQVCFGKLDPVSKELIPSMRRKPEQIVVRDPSVTASASIVGPLLILDSITAKLGLRKLLKSCFPNDYQQIQNNLKKICIPQKERRAIILRNTMGFHARDIFEEPIEGVDLSRVLLRSVDLNSELYPSMQLE